jgi:FlaA1/EpsC-like NDP-sugar epimerase
MAASTGLAAVLLERSPNREAWAIVALMAAVRIVAMVRLGMYRAVLRYSGIHTQFCAAMSTGLGTLIAIATAALLNLDHYAGLGRAFWALEGLITLSVIGGSRLSARMFIERLAQRGNSQSAVSKRVLIFGAGNLGELAFRDLQRVPHYNPIGFLDDAPHRHQAVIHGKRVYGGLADFDTVCQKLQPDMIVVAISDPPPEQVKTLFKLAMAKGIHVLLAKGVGTALDAGGQQLGLRDLALEDLLRRPSRNLDRGPVERLLAGRRVMVTGAGGSIGSELCRQVAAMGIVNLDILDHSEYNLYVIESELRQAFPHLRINPYLVSLTDRQATLAALQATRPEIVFHAAAYKHVPLVEANPFQGIANNVGGWRNLLDAAEVTAVGQLVLISTDKAVRPTNVMGAGKRVCELLLQSRSDSLMRLCAVRFGNVLGSSGSVVPRFLQQIAEGGPVTVTHPDITRYFMLIPEAVGLVLQAAARSSEEETEIFILDMGEPVKIADLARQLIFMHGKDPDHEISVVFTGLRPGEKLYEELLIDDSDHHTDIPDITVARHQSITRIEIERLSNPLLKACSRADSQELVQALMQLVPEWVPSDRLNDQHTQREEITSP